MRNSLIILLVTLLFSCKSSDLSKPIQDDGKISLKFVQLNDVYEIAPLSGGKYGGMSRVAHVVDSIRKIEPNTYLVMAGDFLNPSLLATLKLEDGSRVRGRQMIEVMNAMHFDMVTFGNHEFDLNEEDFQKRLDESNFEWLSSNVKQVKENGVFPFKVGRDIGNIEIPETLSLLATDEDGTQVRFGVFSVTLDSNPREYVHYGDIYSESKNAYKNLGLKNDIIIGLTHVTAEDDMEIARRFPGIDLIMGGHEHNNMIISVGESVVAKADANAKTIYIHTLEWDNNADTVSIDSELFPIDDRIASDPEVEAIVDRWNSILKEKIKQVVENPNEVIYTANPPLDGTDGASRGIQTNLGEIITHAMALSFHEPVEAAILNGGSIRVDDMLAGDITSMDIFRVLPFGGQILNVDMTEDLLIEVLNYGKSSGGTGAYLQRYNINETADGGWEMDGEKLTGGNKFRTVAISDFLLKGYDIPFLTEENPGVLSVYRPERTEPASDVRKAVIYYLQSLSNQ